MLLGMTLRQQNMFNPAYSLALYLYMLRIWPDTAGRVHIPWRHQKRAPCSLPGRSRGPLEALFSLWDKKLKIFFWKNQIVQKPPNIQKTPLNIQKTPQIFEKMRLSKNPPPIFKKTPIFKKNPSIFKKNPNIKKKPQYSKKPRCRRTAPCMDSFMLL